MTTAELEALKARREKEFLRAREASARRGAARSAFLLRDLIDSLLGAGVALEPELVARSDALLREADAGAPEAEIYRQIVELDNAVHRRIPAEVYFALPWERSELFGSLAPSEFYAEARQ